MTQHCQLQYILGQVGQTLAISWSLGTTKRTDNVDHLDTLHELLEESHSLGLLRDRIKQRVLSKAGTNLAKTEIEQCRAGTN